LHTGLSMSRVGGGSSNGSLRCSRPRESPSADRTGRGGRRKGRQTGPRPTREGLRRGCPGVACAVRRLAWGDRSGRKSLRAPLFRSEPRLVGDSTGRRRHHVQLDREAEPAWIGVDELRRCRSGSTRSGPAVCVLVMRHPALSSAHGYVGYGWRSDGIVRPGCSDRIGVRLGALGGPRSESVELLGVPGVG
jgi:hypothetical protein